MDSVSPVANKGLIGYLRLVRLPNVFTALADILAGFTIVRFSSLTVHPPDCTVAAALGVSSAGLYLAGMAFNDLADWKEDAAVRPNRPIPSGQVSLTGALCCGLGLLVLGIGMAASVSTFSLICALFLTTFVLLYDFASKGIAVLGPVTLGFCRFFNVELALSSDPQLLDRLQKMAHWQTAWVPALTVGIYAAGLTAFSAQEESGKRLRSIVTGWLFCGGGIALAAVCCDSPWIWLALGPLLVVLFSLTVRLQREGTPTAARNLVRAGVMGICVLDAGLILGFAGLDAWPLALASTALLCPAILLAKWLAQKEA